MTEPVILNKRYKLEKRLGSGGMAMVYHALDLMLERPVAIKILRRDFIGDSELREQFRLEAKAVANLSHPNIVTVHDFGLDAEQIFIVMEYVPGTDLKSILKRRGRLSVDETINLMTQACAGIGYAHRAGLVHCDVKPQNMLVTPDNRLKVVDFGIARALATILPEEQSEVVWGSPQYFSPEQAAGGSPSPSSDVYSLGVVLYEMLTGHLPFNGSTPEELAQLHRDAPPPPPSEYNPNIPASLEQIVLKVLSKEPSARYRTADQLGRVLQSFGHPASVATVSDLAEGAPETAAVSAVQLSPNQPPPVAVPVFPTTAQYEPPPSSSPQMAPLSGNSLSKNSLSDSSLSDSSLNVDWITWLLALLALIAFGGLIPFWFWVYYMLNPPL